VHPIVSFCNGRRRLDVAIELLPHASWRAMTSHSSPDQLSPANFPIPSRLHSRNPALFCPFVLFNRSVSSRSIKSTRKSTRFARHSAQNGVYQTTQPSQTARVQVCRSGQVFGVQIHPQALLYQCRDQVLSHVHGVSSLPPLNRPRSDLRLQTQCCTRPQLAPYHTDLTSSRSRSPALALSSSTS
jgi:hypothetical protein